MDWGSTALASEGIAVRRQTWTLPGWLRGLLAVGLAAGALALLGLGLTQTRSSVAVEVDGQPFQVYTHATTVRAALEHAGLELAPEDRVLPGIEAPLQANTIVRVQRARPVTLRADGQIRDLRTHATTTGELLAEAGVPAGPGDEIWLDGRLVGAGTPLRGVALPARQPSHRGGPRPAAYPTQAVAPQIVLRRAATLILDDDGVTTTLHTTAATVGQILQAQGVTLFLGDLVTPGLEERIVPRMTVTIDRSIPVEIRVDGHTIRTRTRAENVAGALGQEAIALVGQDTVEPGLDQAIRPHLAIRITRVREDLAVEFEPIPFDTVWVADPEVEIDTGRLVQEGETGVTKRRFRVAYKDGQAVARILEDVWIEQAPITHTLAYGTKIVVRTLDAPEGSIEYWRKMRVYTTSYTAASSGKPRTHPRYGYTRLGWKLTKGIVAVDPEVIPLKTRMYVPGYGFARAGDTGGGIKGKFVDLGFEDGKYQSWHWWTDIYLLTPVPPRSEIRWVLPNWPRFPDRKRR